MLPDLALRVARGAPAHVLSLFHGALYDCRALGRRALRRRLHLLHLSRQILNPESLLVRRPASSHKR